MAAYDYEVGLTQYEVLKSFVSLQTFLKQKMRK